MTEPSVCAIMLTANRPAMARQAVENFRGQTYQRKTLLIVNSGGGPMIPNGYAPDIFEPCFVGADAQTIGELRNRAARETIGHGVDILIHWDDDDYSHPNRISEQIALLTSSGSDCVGYNETLFWREAQILRGLFRRRDGSTQLEYNAPGKAWLYRNPDPQYALGTSLCYWRKTWERKPFEATSQGEDLRFIAGLKVAAVSSIPDISKSSPTTPIPGGWFPRMIARIHPGNTSTAYKPEAMQREAQKRNGMWKRVPGWDSYCAGVFA